MKRILVVDDDADIRQTVKLVLELANYQVQTADNGLTALDEFDSFAPHLIIADYTMPVMNGLEFCIKAKEDVRYQTIPFIFLTASDDPMIKVESLQNGAIDYMTKPFSQDELLARVAAHLTHYDILSNAFQTKVAQTRANLIGNVSHELRTPLAIIMGYIELLLDSVSEQPGIQQQFLHSANQACLRLNNVVEDLIFLTKAQSGEVRFHLNTFSIEPLLVELIACYGNDTTNQIQLKLPDQALPPLLADKNKIEMALRHLINNALKFTSENQSASVLISIEIIAEELWIKITDQGIGLADDQIGEVFDLFHQIDASMTRAYGGIGAGLTITQYIAEHHQGRIQVESQKGQGSTVSLILPLTVTSAFVR